MSHSHSSRLPWYLALIAILSLLVYLLKSVLTPFLLAAVIAYICNPLVTWFELKKIPRTISTVFVMVVMTGLFVIMALILLPLFEEEVTRLIEQIPSFLDMIKNQFVPWMNDSFNIALQIDIASLKQMLIDHWRNMGGSAVQMLPKLKSGWLAVLAFLMNLVLVPVVLFYLLRDWNVLIERIRGLVPPIWQEQVFTLAYEADRVLAEFMRGQIAVMTVMSIYYVTGLWLAGLEFALPIGLISGMLVFVPYLGTVIGLALASFAAIMQFQDWSDIITVWAIVGTGQLLESMLITPYLVGERIGLHPVVVIFALLAFGKLFGFLGILLALPVSAVLLVLLRHLHVQYMTAMAE